MKAELDLTSGLGEVSFMAVPEGKEVYIQIKDEESVLVVNLAQDDLYKIRAYLSYVIEMYK